MIHRVFLFWKSTRCCILFLCLTSCPTQSALCWIAALCSKNRNTAYLLRRIPDRRSCDIRTQHSCSQWKRTHWLESKQISSAAAPERRRKAHASGGTLGVKNTHSLKWLVVWQKSFCNGKQSQEEVQKSSVLSDYLDYNILKVCYENVAQWCKNRLPTNITITLARSTHNLLISY